MSLPTNHPLLKETFMSTYCTSIGGTPAACYVRMPIRGRISRIAYCTQGAITTADCTLTVAVNGTTNAALAGTIPVASAAAGQTSSYVPTSPVYVSEEDYVTITPSGASGSNIGCMFTVTVQMA